MPRHLLKFCSFYFCFLSLYGNTWEEQKLSYAIIFIIERLFGSQKGYLILFISVSHHFPGELWGVTMIPSFSSLASNEFWLIDKFQCQYSLVERLENPKAWI